MPKNRKEALEKYFREKGARTVDELRELIERLGWKVLLRRGETELLKSPVGGAQIVRRRDEVAVKPELRTIRDRVILRAESEGSREPPHDGDCELDEPAPEGPGESKVGPTGKQGGENGA